MVIYQAADVYRGILAQAVEKGWKLEVPPGAAGTKKKRSPKTITSPTSGAKDQEPTTMFEVAVKKDEPIGVSIQKHRGGLAKVVR